MDRSPFVFGIDGVKKVSKESLELLKTTKACGVILFTRNIKNPKWIRGLINSLEDSLGRKLLVMIDHEGGLICRFSSGVTHFPGNFALGKTKNSHYAYEVGRAMAKELLTLGINVNLAPVVDVLKKGTVPEGGLSPFLPAYNPGITIRSFGSDPRLVSRLGCEMIRGMQEEGLSACAKHFPGKGAASLDAHDTLPTIKLSKKTFWQRDLLPFRAAIKSGVDLIMSTHIACPALDIETKPATFSRKIITGLLREQLGFQGVTITDDLGMGAITERESPAFAAVKAANAGHDILLVCHNPKAQYQSFHSYHEALAKGSINPNEHQERLKRIEQLLTKRREAPFQGLYLRRKSEGTVPYVLKRCASPFSLAQEIADKSVRIVQQGTLRLPLKSFQKPFFIFPDLSTLKSRFSFEPGIANLFQEKTLTASLEHPTTFQIPEKPIVFFCFDATNNKFQRQLLNNLQKKVAPRLVVVLIRNPWDLRLVNKKVTVIDALGFRKVQLEAALKIISQLPISA